MFFTETPPPGYISEDGETSDQQMSQSMETGRLAECYASLHTAVYLTSWAHCKVEGQKISFDIKIILKAKLYFLALINTLLQK